MHTATHVRVDVYRDLAEIESVRELWSHLSVHPNSDIDFYSMIHAMRGKTATPYVAVVYRAGCPEAMAIGRIEDSKIEIKLGYAHLPSPRARILSIVYAGLLGDLSLEGGRALVSQIQQSLDQGEADAAVFRFLRTDSAVYEIATKGTKWLQRDHCVAVQPHRGMTLPEVEDGLRLRFSAKVRKNHRWQANKLLQDHQGDVRVVSYRSTPELDVLFRDVERIACKTYQRGLGVGFENTPEMRQRMGFEAGCGRLRGHILYVAGEPAAFWIGTAYKGTFFSSFMGYDPGLARYSPGMFLIMRVIESLCNSGSDREIGFIDFGLGDAAYKALLGDCEWAEGTVYIFARSAKSSVLNLVRTPLFLVDEKIKGSLEKAEVLSKIKHWWRHRTIKTAERRHQRESQC